MISPLLYVDAFISSKKVPGTSFNRVVGSNSGGFGQGGFEREHEPADVKSKGHSSSYTVDNRTNMKSRICRMIESFL